MYTYIYIYISALRVCVLMCKGARVAGRPSPTLSEHGFFRPV